MKRKMDRYIFLAMWIKKKKKKKIKDRCKELVLKNMSFYMMFYMSLEKND